MRSSPRDFRLGRILLHGDAWQSIYQLTHPPLHHHTCSSATYRQRTTPRPQKTICLDGSPNVKMSNVPLPVRTRRRKGMIWAIRRPFPRCTHSSERQYSRDSPRSFRASKSAESRSARKRKDTRVYWIISQETFWIHRRPCAPSSRQPCSPYLVCA